MKLLVKDKTGTQFVVDHSDYPIQKRGGRGHRSSAPCGALKAIPRIHIQLLPEQSIELTCPECQSTRVFSKSGSHYLNLTCKNCIESLGGLDATEKLAEGKVDFERMLKEMEE